MRPSRRAEGGGLARVRHRVNEGETASLAWIYTRVGDVHRLRGLCVSATRLRLDNFDLLSAYLRTPVSNGGPLYSCDRDSSARKLS